LLFVAETWVAEDMLQPQQRPVVANGVAMSTWLVPSALGNLEETGEGKLRLVRLDKKPRPIVRAKENGRDQPAAS
jgi:hypothetical protein